MYYIWVPVTVLIYLFQAWLTVKNNTEGGKWFWIFGLVSLFTPWFIVSKYSKNLMFDAVIFDCILILSFGIGLLYFTKSKLSLEQLLGIVLIGFGIYMFKTGIK